MQIRNIAIVVVIALSAVVWAAEGERVAVVVSSRNPATNISMAALREIYQCERTSWQTGQKITLFSRAAGSPEHATLLRSIFRMNEPEFNQFWVMKDVRGEGSCRVTNLPSKGMTLAAIQSMPGAIVLVRRSDLTPEMKVLKVNGKDIDDPDYPLE